MHRIFINDKGWIEISWGDILDKEVYVQVASQMFNLIESIKHKGEDPLMLIDFSHLVEVKQEVKDAASNATRDLGCRKIAGYGIKPEFKPILDSIKKSSTREDSIGEFATREEAVSWLEQT